ncbi:MAG TPA: hypothetical protein ENF17_09130 [Candidatus Aminicenantes bacterium]|nr:hypothetical protein [Candidatus Aminicenantes bacterium]
MKIASKKAFLIGTIVSGAILLFSPIFLPAETPPGAKTSLQWSGYGQVQYDSFQERTDTFRWRRARLSLKAKTSNGLQLKIQIDPTRAPSLIDLDLSLALSSLAVVHVGQFKVPFSLENLTSSSRLDTINRSRTVELLCPGQDNKAKGRDIGISVSGEWLKVKYSLGLFNGAGINCKDDNDQKDIAGRFVFEPTSSLALGYSFYRGTIGSSEEVFQEKKRRNDLEAQLRTGRFFVRGEWIWGSTGEKKAEGAYILGGYELVSDKALFIFRLDKVDPDKSSPIDDFKVTTFGLTWFLGKKSKLQINYEIHQEKEIKVDNNVFLTQLQIGF